MRSTKPHAKTMPDVSSLLRSARQQVAESDSATLDTEVLLAFVLDKERAWLLAHPGDELTEEQANAYQGLLDRRQIGEPVAYLVGRQEFYGRTFAVTPDVLVPRPESEQLVELVLGEAAANDTVVDIGTGSGCLAITLKLERPELTVIGSDISPAALEIAKQNAQALGAEVSWQCADLCPVLRQPENTIVLANLPYVPTADYQKSPSIHAEPRLALDGGPDGLVLISRLLTELAGGPKVTLLEIDPSQAAVLTRDWNATIVQDLASRDRFAVIEG